MFTNTTEHLFGTTTARRAVGGFLCLLLVAAVMLLVASSIIFVGETEFVISERLGHIVAVYDRPDDRGLHFKLPWPIGTVRRFDRRVQLFDPPAREVFTRDKKNITVDAYVCWKIAGTEDTQTPPISERPVVRFFRSSGNIDAAQARLNSRVHSIVSTRIGQVELSELLNVDGSESGPDAGDVSLLHTISTDVRQLVEQRPDEEASLRESMGLEIADVRIKRINFPLGNQQAVFERMKSERRKIADRYRSAGMAENTVIKSYADRQYNDILAKANADAERIRGEAEAEAITILNRAHAQDPAFYRIIRTLDSYRRILNERTTLVLSASSNMLKMLTEGIPEIVPATRPRSNDPIDPPQVKPSNLSTSTVRESKSVPDGNVQPQANPSRTAAAKSDSGARSSTPPPPPVPYTLPPPSLSSTSSKPGVVQTSEQDIAEESAQTEAVP